MSEMAQNERDKQCKPKHQEFGDHRSMRECRNNEINHPAGVIKKHICGIFKNPLEKDDPRNAVNHPRYHGDFND